MANPEHLEILKQGVEVWNEWRRKIKESPNLSEANLTYADLSKADLSKADLSWASLSLANLSEADLSEADLSEADLSRANLKYAYLSKADLKYANLSEADLSRANLKYANLTYANLSEADLSWANLKYANLTYANLFKADLFKADLYESKLVKVSLTEAILNGAYLSEADLTESNLTGATLIETNLEKSILTNCRIYGISAWNINLQNAIQKDLIITQINEPTITVDNLEIAQFIHLLLHSEKIRNIIDTITSKVVLILGRFTPERKIILDAIRDKLRDHNYLPILFDFEGPTSRDTHETVSTLAHMARFVIADITDAKSIPQELGSIIPNLTSVPVQPLLGPSDEEYGLFEHFKKFPWVLGIFQYRDLNHILDSLEDKVIKPAEKKVIELRRR